MRLIRRVTPEEKVAKQLEEIVCDLRIDLDMVGHYLAQNSPLVAYNRFMAIADSAEHTKESYTNGINQYTLF